MEENPHGMNKTHGAVVENLDTDVPILRSQGLGAPAGKRPRTARKQTREQLDQPIPKPGRGARHLSNQKQEIRKERKVWEDCPSYWHCPTIFPSPNLCIPRMEHAPCNASLQWKGVSGQLGSIANGLGKQPNLMENSGNSLYWTDVSISGQEPKNKAFQTSRQIPNNFFEGSKLQNIGLGILLDRPIMQAKTEAPHERNAGSQIDVLGGNTNCVAPGQAAAAPDEDPVISTDVAPVQVLASDGQSRSARAVCAIANLLTDDRSPMLNRGSKAKRPRPSPDVRSAAQDIVGQSDDTSRWTALNSPANQGSITFQTVETESLRDTSRHCQDYNPWDPRHWTYPVFGVGAAGISRPLPETMDLHGSQTMMGGPFSAHGQISYSKPTDKIVRRRPWRQSVKPPKDQATIQGSPKPKKRRIVEQTKKDRPDKGPSEELHGNAKSPPENNLGGTDTDHATSSH
ncbi:MAG: hypothetical protein Q9174_005655, partial [Haloplaca sp. 1 TL-2023]